MNDFILAYAKQTHQYFNKFYANYFPENPIELGSVGELTDGCLFDRKGNVKDARFGLTFNCLPETVQLPIKGDETNHYQYITDNGSSYKVHGKGSAHLAKGGVEVGLTTENSFFINIAGAVVQEIADQLTLADDIIRLYKEGKWNKDHAIVTALCYSSSTIILGSKGGSQTVTLEAKTDVPGIDLQNAELQFNAKGHENLGMQMITGPGRIPFFRLSRLKKKFLGDYFLGMNDAEEDLDDLRERVLDSEMDINEFIELAPIV